MVLKFSQSKILVPVIITISAVFLIFIFYHRYRWRYIVIHHTAFHSGSLASIRNFHMNTRGWPDIAYHFVINNGTNKTKDGEIESSEIWHKKRGNYSTSSFIFNQQSIAIVLVGNFEKENPTSAQLHSLTNLAAGLAVTYDIPFSNIIGHSSITQTLCPGKNLNIEKIKEEIKKLLLSVHEP